jgi:HD-like signal output (HDOD) protein
MYIQGRESMDEPRKKIGEVLVSVGMVTEEQLREGLRRQKERGGKMVETLIELGFFDADAFAKFMSSQPGIASIDLPQYDLSADLIALVPQDFATTHRIVPLDLMGGSLTVAAACPLDTEPLDDLEQRTKLKVQALLCAAADIDNVIRRYYGDEPTENQETHAQSQDDSALAFANQQQMGSALRLSALPRLMEDLQELPSMPETVQKVQEALTDEDVGLATVAGVLRRDPAVVATMLRVANSPAFGFSHKVESIDSAVSLLGLRETYAVVVSASTQTMFKFTGAINGKRFWRDSLCCAQTAAVLSRARGVKRVGRAYAAALLHDVGRLILAILRPKLYAKLDPLLDADTLIEEEHRLFGVDHSEVGYQMAASWLLPADMAEAIRFHNGGAENASDPDFARMIQAAAIMSSLTDRSTADMADYMRVNHDDLLDTLGLSDAIFETLCQITHGMAAELL